MKCLLATKIGMSQLWSEEGKVVPVTVVSVAPNVVAQVRTKETDGYEAVQVGTGTTKKNNKPDAGHVKGLGSLRWLREFRMPTGTLQRGATLKADLFVEGDTVQVSGMSKGKGFQGVVKRHGFKGGPASHGHPHNLRAPGSIGCRFPQHTHRGKRMAGRMGFENVTIRNLTVVKVDAQNGLLALKGAIPGVRGTLVRIVGK